MEFLDQQFLDNSIRSYLTVLLIILVVLVFRRFVSRYIASLGYRSMNKMLRNVDRQNFLDLIAQPIRWFLLTVVTVFSLDKLNYPSALDFSIYGHTAADILARTGPGLIIASFIWLVLRLVDFVALVLEQKAQLTNDTRDNQLIVFFRDFLKVIITVIGILWIIKVCFHQPIGSILTGLSIVGAALALAAKESLENLIASFIIFFDKPFFTGDTVKVNQVAGTVEHIGLRSTRIRTAEKTLVTVPNKQMVDTMLDNWSLRTARRAEIRLELDQQTPIARVQELMNYARQLMQQQGESLQSFEVVLKDIGKTGLLIQIEFYTQPVSLADFDQIKQAILIPVKQFMEERGISFAAANPA